MTQFTAVHESLPYIDTEPTPEQRSAAQSLVSTEVALLPSDLHVPAPYTSPFSPLLQAELERKRREAASGTREPLSAIDLSRYEAQEPPSAPTTSTPDSRAALREALRKAYASHAYLGARRENLELLDAHGRNAWLLGNYQLEGELKALEAELAETKRQIDILAVARKQQQEEVAGEMKGLEETWKKTIGRMLETEIAAEELRVQVLAELRLKDQAGPAG